MGGGVYEKRCWGENGDCAGMVGVARDKVRLARTRKSWFGCSYALQSGAISGFGSGTTASTMAWTLTHLDETES